MALSTKTSETFKGISKEEEYKESVEKYDISNYMNLYRETNSAIDEMYEITEQYTSPEEIERNVYLSLDNYTGSQTIIVSNEAIIYSTKQNMVIPQGAADDDSNRRPTTNIQNDLLNIYKIKDFAAIEKTKNDKLINRYNLYKERLKKFENRISASQENQKRETKQAFIKAIKFIKYTSTTILCVINYVVLINIFNPASWVNIGLAIYNNAYLYRFFTNTMGYLNLFNTLDLLSLDKLFEGVQIFLKSENMKNLTSDDRDKYVKLILQKVFQPGTVDVNNITNEFPFYQPNSPVETFFVFIYNACQKINIFDADKNKFLQQDWLVTVFQFAQTPYAMYGLSQLGLIFNTLAYFERAEKAFNSYSEINPMIIFKEATINFTQSITFNEYNRLISSKMLESVLGEQTATVISEVPFMIDWFGTEMNVSGELIKQLTKEDVQGFFITTTQSLISILTTSNINGYFYQIEKEAKDKQLEQNLVKTMDDKILEIETNIRKRGFYILNGYSNEKIESLLSAAPKENDYKFFALKFMKDFYNNFGDISDDPIAYIYKLTSTISLSKILEALLKPHMLIAANIYTIQKFVLSGMYNTEIFNIRFFGKISIKDIGIKVLQFFLGNDAKLNKDLNLLRNKIINDLTNDIQILLADISKIFFDTRIGIKIKSFINKINSTIFGKLFTMSCKIIFNITAIPQFQLYLSRKIPISDIKFFNIFKDKNTLIKYFSVIRNKISNLFTIMKDKKQINNSLFNELKSFFEIQKIVFNNVMPFVANNGYYFYDVNKPFEFKGNSVKTLNNLFIERLAKEEKKPLDEQENLLEYQPKPSEIEKEIIIINYDDINSMLTTVNKKEIIDDILSQGSITLPVNRNNDVFLFYYYKKFVDFKKQQNTAFKNTDEINLKEFDDYLSDLSNDLRSDFLHSNGIKYAIINDLRSSFEEKYPKSVLNLYSDKKIKESFILNNENSDFISNFIDNIDIQNQTKIKQTKIVLKDLLNQNPIITTPFYTDYGSVPVISDMNEFLKTTELINLVESTEQSQDIITVYQELETLAVKDNNNNIYSDLANLDYRLSKPLKIALKQIGITNEFIKKYLPGALTKNDPNDEFGVTFKHLGFDYNNFTTKITDNLKNTTIGTKNEIFLDKITESLDIEVLADLIISESEISYVCDNGNEPLIFLDHSKSIDIYTGNQYNCDEKFIKNISDYNKNIDVIKKILFTPEVILRLNGNFNFYYNKLIKNPKYLVLINGKRKIKDFFVLISKIVNGINVNGQKVTTIYDVIDETIEEISYPNPSKIESYKLEILKNFQISLKESVKRGYIDKDILNQVNNFFRRKEILLDRYDYINRIKTELNDNYSNLINECGKITADPNSRAQALTELANLKKIIETDRYNNSFTLSDIKSTKPGGSEDFTMIDNINKKFNDEKNSLQQLQAKLVNLRKTMTEGTNLLSDLDEFCRISTDSNNGIKSYIDDRNKSFDEQFNLYKISLLGVSEDIFSDLKTRYEKISNNIKKILITYEEKLEQLKNKYTNNNKSTIPGPPLISPAFNPLNQQNVQPTPSPTKVSTSPTTEIKKPTTEQAKDLKSAEKLSQSLGEKVKKELTEDIALKEEQEHGLEESIDEGLTEDEKLQLGQELAFSGSDNTFNYLANLINVIPPIVTTTPTTNIELEQIEEKGIKQDNKNSLDVCKSYSGQWKVSYLDAIYDITPINIAKEEAIACSSNNLLYVFFDYINIFCVSSLTYFNWFMNTLSWVFGPTSCAAGSGLPGIGFIIRIVCEIYLSLKYLGACVLYVWHFSLSFTVDSLIKDKTLLDDNKANISLKFFVIAWFYSSMSANKIIIEKKVDSSSCWVLDYLFKRIYSDFDMNKLEEAPRAILSQFDTSDKINENAIGVIDLGRTDNGINLSDPTELIVMLKQTIKHNDLTGINSLTSKVEKKTIKCDDFNFSNKNSVNTLRYVILGTIQNLILLKPITLLTSYLGCLLIDDVNAIDNFKKGGLLYLATAWGKLTLNTIKILRAIQDTFVILLADKGLRPLVMTYFFGSPSTNKNKNLPREMIENSIKILEGQFPKDEEFIQALKADVDENFGKFFNLFMGTLTTIWKGIKNLIIGEPITEEFTLDKKIVDDYDFYIKSKATVSELYSSLVEPAVTLIQDNTKIFTSIPPEYQIQNINSDDELFNVLEKMKTDRSDPAKEDAFYNSFVFTDTQQHQYNDVNKPILQTINIAKKKKIIINQYIKILQLYKKQVETHKAVNTFILENAKNSINQWFNFPFNNFMVVEKMTGGDIKSAISYHLLKPCKNDEIMSIKDTDPPTPECIKISEEYIKQGGEAEFNEMMTKYETQFTDLAKSTLEKSHKEIDAALNIRTNLNDIIVSLNSGYNSKSKEYINVEDIDDNINKMVSDYADNISQLNIDYENASNKIDIDHNELENITQNYYYKSIDMLKKYIKFLIEIKNKVNDGIGEYIKILETQKRSKNDKENSLKEYKDNGKEPDETDDDYNTKIQDLESEINNIGIIIKDFEQKINDNKSKFDKFTEELNNLSNSDISQNNFQDKYTSLAIEEAKKTNDPLYFTYLYTNIVNNIHRYNLDLNNIFKVLNDPNLTTQVIKSELSFKISGNKYFFDDDELNNKIIQYRQNILNILGFYIYENNKLLPSGAYRQITRSDIMYIGNKEVKNNQELMKLLPGGDKTLQLPPQTGTIKHRITKPIYQELYKYGYYLRLSTSKDTEKTDDNSDNRIRSAVIFGKISTRFNDITSDDPLFYDSDSAEHHGLFGKTDDYINNNGSTTKFQEMIPPILLDYKRGKYHDLDEFVSKNYLSFSLNETETIFVLKSNLQLYLKSYNDFKVGDFFTAISNIIEERKQKITAYKNTFKNILYWGYFSYYDEYYDIGFDYFNNLTFKSCENSELNTINKIAYNDYLGIDKILALLSISPISVFQPNLNNINLDIDYKGDVTSMNYRINDNDIAEI